ncbi:MAG: dodecin family protein [Bacteroidota bacterium]|nr:dodecin family protein [Bacteroidota bacterium]
MTTAFEFVEVVGVSTKSVEDAVQNAVRHVSATRGVSWFEIVSIRGRIVEPSRETEYQVTVKFGCRV